MNQGWPLVFLTFMLAGGAVTTAQQILTPTGTTNLKLSIAASERRVGLYADYADQSAVLVLGSGARRFSDAQLLLPSTGSASPHFVSLESYRGQPVASGGGWVFVADHINGAGGGRLLEIKTGQWTSISTIPGVTFAAISGDRLALLGLEHSGSAVGSRAGAAGLVGRDASAVTGRQEPKVAAMPGFSSSSRMSSRRGMRWPSRSARSASTPGW